MKTPKEETITKGETINNDDTHYVKSSKDWQQRHHQNSDTHGILAVILVGLGAIFLLRNFDLLPPDFWDNIWKLWPLALIGWGIHLLFGKGWLANLIVMLITLLIVYFLLSYFNPNLNIDLNKLIKK